MKAYDYQEWLIILKDHSSHFRTRFAYTFQYEGGLLTNVDKQVFNCYQSFLKFYENKYAEKLAKYDLSPLPEFESRAQSPKRGSVRGSKKKAITLPTPLVQAVKLVYEAKYKKSLLVIYARRGFLLLEY